MAEVKVPLSKDNAVLLLDAAEKAGESADVVRTSGGVFVVDEALAKKAKVDYKTEADEEKEAQERLAADDEASGYKRPGAKKAAAAKTAAHKE